MCGRYTLHTPLEVIAQIFGILKIDLSLQPEYNIAPGRDVAVVVRRPEGDTLTACRWGFLPPWAKSSSEGSKMINARAETLAERPSFREVLRNSRCLVPADGFYEWKKEGATRMPVYVRPKSGGPIGFAGLYSLRTPPSGAPVLTCAIITVAANELIRPFHDRMPAILPPADRGRWLDPGVHDADKLLPLLVPCPSGLLEAYPVSSRVNSPANNTAENIVSLAPR